MKCENRWLLSELAQVTTTLSAFAQHVMCDTAIPTERPAVFERLIALGQATIKRAGNLTVTTATLHDGTSDANGADTHALSALVDMTDVLSRTPGTLTVGNVLPAGWCEWLG
jgi:hypothetical protein